MGVEPTRPEGHWILNPSWSHFFCVGLTGHLGCNALFLSRIRRFGLDPVWRTDWLRMANIVSDLCQITGQEEQSALRNLLFRKAFNQAGELGFEPRLSDPESLVLPLHYSPVQACGDGPPARGRPRPLMQR